MTRTTPIGERSYKKDSPTNPNHNQRPWAKQLCHMLRSPLARPLSWSFSHRLRCCCVWAVQGFRGFRDLREKVFLMQCSGAVLQSAGRVFYNIPQDGSNIRRKPLKLQPFLCFQISTIRVLEMSFMLADASADINLSHKCEITGNKTSWSYWWNAHKCVSIVQTNSTSIQLRRMFSLFACL
jgi:hypothetical protein